MKIKLNGAPHDVDTGLTLADLVQTLALSGRVAIEVNGEVIRRALHAEHRLTDGDQVEIVTFVGGG